MEILKNFGVDPMLFGAQIVNFLIILYLLKRFAYKPIFKILEDRKKTIEEGITNAQESAKSLDRALEKEKDILKKAQQQGKIILEDSQKQAESFLALSQENAKKQVEKMITDAKKEIDRQTTETRKQLAAETTTIAISIVEKALSGFFDDKEQTKVLEKVVKQLKK